MKSKDMQPSKPKRLLLHTLLKEENRVIMTSLLTFSTVGTDSHQTRDEWGASSFPMVPGHEITGIVTGVGTKVGRHKMGEKVAVGCFVDSCRKCGPCSNGLEQYCVEGPTMTYNSTEKDGQTRTQGGYSEKIVVDENYVLRVPENPPLDRAAPLLCAGITMYSPLMHWKAGPGKRVGIVGLGGLGHMGRACIRCRSHCAKPLP